MGIIFCSNFADASMKEWSTYSLNSSLSYGTASGGHSGLPGGSVYLTEYCFAIKSLPPATEYYFGCWLSALDLGLTGAKDPLMRFFGPTLSLGYLAVNQTTKEIGWYDQVTTTWISSGVTMNLYEVAHLEVRFRLHSSTGIIQIRKNGVEIYSYSGNTGSVDGIYGIGLGSGVSNKPDYGVAGVTVSNSDWVGPVTTMHFYPTASGGTSQLSPTAGDNYNCVNDVPWSSSYVKGQTDGLKDIYEKNAFTFPERFDSYKALSVHVSATRGGVVVTKVKPLLQIGGTNYNQSAESIPYSGNSGVANIFETNPAGGAWTQSSISAAKLGVELET